jgi:hypothetical protein
MCLILLALGALCPPISLGLPCQYCKLGRRCSHLQPLARAATDCMPTLCLPEGAVIYAWPHAIATAEASLAALSLVIAEI